MRADGKLLTMAELDVFAGYGRRALKTMSSLCTGAQLDGGDVLVAEGDLAGQSFIIVSGVAEASVGGRAVARVGRGDGVAVRAVLDGRRSTATVVAVGPMVVLALAPHELARLVDVTPTVEARLRAADGPDPERLPRQTAEWAVARWGRRRSTLGLPAPPRGGLPPVTEAWPGALGRSASREWV